ncbi:hypothetical protein C0995_008805, partial [Termitomyces sp. Mi166
MQLARDFFSKQRLGSLVSQAPCIKIALRSHRLARTPTLILNTMSFNNPSAFDLFPIPSSPSSSLVPKHWPGISTESTAVLQEVLKDNHVRWNIFFNDSGFH